jgi:4-amino-4-deoxy-L-arabinose transferase-like glycosyltransferase
VSRRAVYASLVLVSALPRLVVLLVERGDILAGSVEKSDIFARTFVESGTYGFLPGQPSAYTQPLYGWFLVPVYWIFGRSWISIGLAQIAVAAIVAVLVYEIARRLVPRRWALAAAGVATLHPYLVWHDVHVNREIVDQLCAAALVLLTLRVAERPSRVLAPALGAVTGLALLGNSRLVFVPILCAGYLLLRRTPWPAVVLVLVAAAVITAPWLVRNKLQVGCWAITTDARALWKANNEQTYGLLSSGKWIDDIRPGSVRPPEPGHLTPEEAYGVYLQKGRVLHPDECVAMSFYEDRALEFVRDHPGEKLRLAALSERLLWQPDVIETTGNSRNAAERWVEPAYMIAVYALAAFGLVAAPPAFSALALALFAYNSIFAAIFVGATRYRVSLDFLLVLLGACAVAQWRERRA